MKRILVVLMIQILISTPVLALNGPVRTNDQKNLQTASAVDWWPMFCHDVARTANTSAPAPDITHAVWSHMVQDWIEASPCLVDGKVYVATCNWWKGRIHCLDLYNGSFLWNYTINDQLFSSPAVSNGNVYEASLNGRVFCLNASTGQQIWNVLLDTDILIQSSPVISDGNLYISCTNENPGSNKSRLFCLRTEDGSILWSNSTKNARDITPAVVDGKVYGAGASNLLTCFDALTGEMLWQSEEQITTGHPVVVNNHVFGTSDDSVFCIHDGTTHWTFPLKPGFLIPSTLTIASGRLVVGALNPYAYIPGMIHCINIETGDEYWNFSSENNGEYNAKPTIAQNRLYIVEDVAVGSDRRARLCCFDLFTGELLMERIINPDSTNYVFGTASIADGVLVLGSAESDATTAWGGIYCYGDVSIPQPQLNITGISGGKGVTIEIENSGDANATGVTVEVLITGGLFIHQGHYSYPETIEAGKKETVIVPLFGIGFGILKDLPQVAVTIACTEQSAITVYQQFKIFFSTVKIIEE